MAYDPLHVLVLLQEQVDTALATGCAAVRYSRCAGGPQHHGVVVGLEGGAVVNLIIGIPAKEVDTVSSSWQKTWCDRCANDCYIVTLDIIGKPRVICMECLGFELEDVRNAVLTAYKNFVVPAAEARHDD
jgi:hypothetical protein